MLTAFQNVADALHALDSDEQTLAAAEHARDATEKSLAVSRRQLELGSVGYLALLNAQRAYQQAMITWVQAEISRYIDTAALFQALGGAMRQSRPHSRCCPRRKGFRIEGFLYGS